MNHLANGHSNGNVVPAHHYAVHPSPQQLQKQGAQAPNLYFLPAQLALLKDQIVAFKNITKDKLTESGSPTTAQRPETPLQLGSSSLSGSPATPASVQGLQKRHSSTTSAQPTTRQYTAFASPYTLLKTYPPASRQQRLLVPSIMPIGIDPQALVAEREHHIKARLQKRISELEKPTHNQGKENGVTGLDTATLKSIIELKSLKLYEKQQMLRDELTQGMIKSTRLATPEDRHPYHQHPDRRLVKKPRKTLAYQDAIEISKADREHRKESEARKKQEREGYFKNIKDRGEELLRVRSAWNNKQSSLGRAVQRFHAATKEEEQKKQEIISKERIRALKMDDEEAYMKLLDEAKDTRLTQLLRQTGTFLESLSKAVIDQQNDAVYRSKYTDQDDDDMGDTDKNGKVDYFQVAHRIKEEVEQPGLLEGGTLKNYQLKGLQWMVSLYNNHLNGILADEMGLGKTIQTIALITYLIERKKVNGPFLIVVPLTTLTNWILEFDKWAPNVIKIAYKGSPKDRKALSYTIKSSNFQVLLTTFEYIIRDKADLKKTKWVYMIMDEGHRLKNSGSKLSQALRHDYKILYRLILTGTPLQNNLPELWNLLNFILPKIFKSVKSFEEWFNTPFENQGLSDKVSLNEEEQLLIIKRLHKVLRPFLLRRLKKDVESEMPDKVEQVVKCKLSALQQKLYIQIKKNGGIATSEKGTAGMKALNNTIMHLRKICNHPFLWEHVENTINPSRQSNDLLYRVSGKFELLDRMLPKLYKTGHRVLMFFQMTQVMNIMEDFLHYRNFKYLRLDGTTKSDDRAKLLQQFNAPNSPYFMFLLSTRAGGLGLNLQTADTVVLFDSDWNPHQDLQAQDRAHRIGQTKEVRIFRLISTNSIEENILAKANYKLEIDGKVIQAGKFDNQSKDEDREAFLRSLLETKEDEDEEGEHAEFNDDELNEILKRSDEELVIFEEMDDMRRRQEDEIYRRLGGRGKKLERLIQEEEIPDIYRNEIVEQEEPHTLEYYGRGQRTKETVHYDEGPTEEEWAEAQEADDEELLNELEARRLESRRARRAENAGPFGMTEEMYDESNKKRGRPKKGEHETQRKRNKKLDDPFGQDSIAPHIREQMTRIFMECYRAVEESTAEEDGQFRSRAVLFMDVVNKKEYPEYFAIIKSPIAMNIIKKRINSAFYKSIAHFRADFHLMFDNARKFNMEGSDVYNDADEMQRILDGMLNQLCPGDMLPPTYAPPAVNTMSAIPSHGGKHPFAYGNHPSIGHSAWQPAETVPMQMPFGVPQHPQEQIVRYDDEDDEEEEEDEYEDDDYNE